MGAWKARYGTSGKVPDIHYNLHNQYHLFLSVHISVADPGGGGLGGLTPPPPFRGCFLFFFACQYMKIPTDLDPNPPPPFRRILAQNPPFEFLDPPLYIYIYIVRFTIQRNRRERQVYRGKGDREQKTEIDRGQETERE